MKGIVKSIRVITLLSILALICACASRQASVSQPPSTGSTASTSQSPTSSGSTASSSQPQATETSAPPPPPPLPPFPQDSATTRRDNHGLIINDASRYTVVWGDTLASISTKLYGRSAYFPVILLASYEIVSDMDVLLPGMVLIVPNLQANLNDPYSKDIIKRYMETVAAVKILRNRFDDSEELLRVALEM
jgi:hypothetical protein